YENLWCAPIVLVGHSFGGLVIKSLVVEIKRRMNQKTSNDIDVTTNARSKDFYDNLTGVIFYGTPHEGGTKTFSAYFVRICQDMGDKTHSITQQSLLQNVQEILVPYASAQRLSSNNCYKIEDLNHLTICKPPTRDHISYSKLVDYLKICLK
ncbi:unnamed protein product, partial [Sphagnum jensenii]